MIYYSASELGGCLRTLWAKRVGKSPLPVSEQTQQMFDRGHELESDVLDWLYQNEGWNLQRKTESKDCLTHWGKCEQVEVQLKINSTVSIVAHLDALACPWPKDRNYDKVVEVKSMGPATFEKFKDKGLEAGGHFERYKWQVSVQGLATGLPVVVVGVNSETGDCSDLHMIVVNKPYYSRLQVIKRVLEVEQAAEGGVPAKCDLSSYPCPFFYLHDDDGGRERVDDPELEKLAIRYKAIECASKRLELQLTEVKNELRARVRMNSGVAKDGDGGCKLVTGKVKVTTWWQKNPPRLDKAKLEEKGLKVEDVTSQSRSERMKVEVEGGD